MAKLESVDIELGITRLEYGDAARPQRAVLTLSTRKYSRGGLISDATVYWVSQHSRQCMISFAGDGDFTKRLLVTDRTVKATQKNLDKCSKGAFLLEVVVMLVDAAKAHYAPYVRDGVDGFKNVYIANDRPLGGQQ